MPSSGDEILQHVEPEDLLNFGFIPEFVGRLPMVTTLAELTEDQLVSILTEPKNALTKQYAKLLAMEGVDLEFTPDALRELAAQAIKKGTGARALRGLIEKLMLDVMYDVPEQRRHPGHQDHAAGRVGRDQAHRAPQARPRRRLRLSADRPRDECGRSSAPDVGASAED